MTMMTAISVWVAVDRTRQEKTRQEQTREDRVMAECRVRRVEESSGAAVSEIRTV